MNKYLVRSVLFVAGIMFLVLLAVRSWDDLSLLLQRVHWIYFMFAVSIAVMGNITISFLMRKLYDKYGVCISCGLSHKIYFYAQIAKYIPGKVWAFWYQATLLKTPRSTSAMLFVNLDLIAFLVILTTSMAVSLLVSDYSLTLSLILFLIGLLAGIWTAKSCVVFRFVRRCFSSLTFMKDKLCSCHTRISSVAVGTYYILFSTSYLVSHLLLLYAAFNYSFSQSIHYTAYLTLAWIVGAFSFIVPGGVGVKELVFIMLSKSLSGDISLEELSAIAIISRFAVMLQEMIGVFFAYLWDSYQK